MDIENSNVRKIKGGITSPKGYYATGSHIGIKEKKKDLAIISSSVPTKAVGVFTTNIVKAAPVLWNQKLIRNNNLAQAIVVNSGNANACTGEIGLQHAELMANELAICLGLRKDQVFVASTGVIGVPLPIDNIINGIKNTYKKLGNSEIDANLAAEAIMTTDKHSKEVSVEFTIDEREIRIGGMAKGSGMIHPNMATMLSFITTDLNISKELLEKALKESSEDSYNMISVDGDTSTNDMVILMANGFDEPNMGLSEAAILYPDTNPAPAPIQVEPSEITANHHDDNWPSLEAPSDPPPVPVEVAPQATGGTYINDAGEVLAHVDKPEKQIKPDDEFPDDIPF
ncbi:hypothetical protein LCGC14_1770580 [marine sediment metagenome]|uniref:Glutamate N-acetyltransferase n=1 Tax=marine sediment metagenome TaxID=412755 RepID=A0A0F9GYG5_9ZZZZ